MKLKKTLITSFVIASAFIATSCATSFSMRIQRAADVDLNGAKSITVSAIVPPSGKSVRSDDISDVIDYLQTNLEQKLYDSGYYQVVDKRDRRNIPDVYFDSSITKFKVEDNRQTNKTKDEDDNEIITYSYNRRVDLEISYKYVDSETNKVIESKTFSANRSSNYAEDPRDLPVPFNMIKSDLDSFITKIMKQIEPYYEDKTFTLLKDKSKNEEFKIADGLAKKGFYEEALEGFTAVYESTEMFEAGYNAAILMEALGYLDKAEESMNNLYIVYGNKKALSALKDIRTEKAKAAKLQRQAQN